MTEVVFVPQVGMPATIHLAADSIAAVVVKVNAKSVVVRRVEIDESSRTRVNDEREPFPCWAWNGIIDKPVGEAERYALVGQRYRNGSISLTLGRSVKVRDYRE